MDRVGIKRDRKKNRSDRIGDAEIDELDSFVQFIEDAPDPLHIDTPHGRTVDLLAFSGD